jgi:hypothetical protein
VTKVVIGATEIRPSSTITSSTDLEYLQSLIGLQFPPYPAGIHIDPFYLITPQINGTWGIAYEKYNGNHYIWLSFLVSRGENKTWEASDVIKIPNPSEEQFLIPGGCKMFGEFDSEIQAIVTINERDQSRRYVNSKAVNYAWRADRVTGLFSQLDTNYIE